MKTLLKIGILALLFSCEPSNSPKEVYYEKICDKKEVTHHRGFHWVAFGINKEFGTNCDHWSKSKTHYGDYAETRSVKYKMVKIQK